MNVNHFGQNLCKFATTTLRADSRAAGNSTYPKGGGSFSADTFVQAESSVLRMKFCGKNRQLLEAAKR